MIPGLVMICQNDNVTSLKSQPWVQLLEMMGKEGEAIMTSLIVDCGLYVAIANDLGNYVQLSGK